MNPRSALNHSQSRSPLYFKTHAILCCFALKLAREPGNKDASEKLEKIPSLREDLKSAQNALNSGDFQGAIDLLSPAIEVCQEITCMYNDEKIEWATIFAVGSTFFRSIL